MKAKKKVSEIKKEKKKTEKEVETEHIPRRLIEGGKVKSMSVGI